jgi:hypothetical protein
MPSMKSGTFQRSWVLTRRAAYVCGSALDKDARELPGESLKATKAQVRRRVDDLAVVGYPFFGPPEMVVPLANRSFTLLGGCPCKPRSHSALNSLGVL